MTDSNHPTDHDPSASQPTDESQAGQSAAVDEDHWGDDQHQQPATAARGAPAATQASARQNSTGRLPDEHRVVRLLTWGALGISCVVGIVALIQFYSHATATIATVVTTEYESLFLAGFNLIVLLAAGIAVSLLVRELTDGGAPTAGE